jgi:hypothetical protein
MYEIDKGKYWFHPKNFEKCFLKVKKPLTTSVLWKNFDQKVVSAGKWGMEAGKFWIFCGFDVHFASFAVWNLAFLGNVSAFHFCSMWILTTIAFHSPKVHLYFPTVSLLKILLSNTHLTCKMLNMRIPSASPQICTKSSFVMRNKSAPLKWANVAAYACSRWKVIHWAKWAGVDSLVMNGV